MQLLSALISPDVQTGSMSSGALNLGAFQSADLDQLVSHYPPEVRKAAMQA